MKLVVSESLSKKAEALAEGLGLAFDDLLGLRFAANVFLSATIVSFTLRAVGDHNAIWAIASMDCRRGATS